MYEKILFPTDFSEYVKKTLECIGDIPKVKDVVLLHVIDATHLSKHGWTHGQHIEDARIRLEEQKRHLESLGLRVETYVETITEGSIPDVILKIADDEKVSLIVMNAKGNSLIKGLLLGSTSLGVIRCAKTDVLVMRHKLVESLEGEKFEKFCPRILSKVLCPTDFSKPAEDTLSFIKDMEGIQEIVLVNVVTKGDTTEEIDTNVLEAKKRLDEIKEKFAGLKVENHIRVGHPAEEICSLAEDEDVSLIAMSSHGKSWLDELLLGDTVFDVIKIAKRPVLIIRYK